VGWNVVTGYLPSAARNMGQDDQLEHDDRYDYADEYLEVLYKLWEGSSFNFFCRAGSRIVLAGMA
jgi:alkanesulfonate monooxygenase SsuD/methylene tetrahydromethanopterin reductase-like flavin-dependent oxidoreductase (luciferase family)